MNNKSKKHVIITGGSSGIGKALACYLAQQGHNISIIAQDQNKLTAAVKDIENFSQNSSQVLALSADVAKEFQVRKAIENAVKIHGMPDILITSAGFSYPDYFDNLNIDIFEKTMAINYLGSLYAIKAVFPYMKKEKSGHIVLISSGAGLMGLFGYSAYSPSKFAIRGLAESLRPEFKRLGINISIAYPPDTDTPQLAQENLTKPEETKKIVGPMKLRTADEVAKCIIKGINKNKFHISPGVATYLIRLSHSFLFSPLNYYFDKIIQHHNAD
ncbi:SDR family oxidoreductase [Legionella jordanis]|uniref:3-dehydrosphinganine reductase n=1 Tax=Legionella jordanis TaxID=456 RepID=A0A0W0VGJ1_9GAMM|nr:SDR family oxidoreductase [Legionella jordanis]KTD19240.1 Estradiol 17-beta-dehydrogenase [Legionella jordanis]RMW99824.1 SDR family NAD(P)-dependent oxidoreductase [Legionella jordanis]RMX18777.1 SDR family NAD(P)-dependent oxidoreductase [Legionella jordanis]VEH12874.1 retinol dehydrogenase [Legionella jordanis]HAT8714872.1 SDR family NAD(P)-dependent oxidoreductase [Legionella jordanis]